MKKTIPETAAGIFVQVWRCALRYFLAVFAAGFALGALRVMLVAPHLGALASVALELPAMLAVSWLVAGAILRREPVVSASPAARLCMGIIAFGLLMLAEALLARQLSGRSLAEFLRGLATSAGALGLAGQIGFALVPWLRRR